MGPWPEAAAVYEERSPLSRLDGFDVPIIVLQGPKDEVVPPAQAELIVSGLRARGVPHAYLTFADEMHGFRRADRGTPPIVRGAGRDVGRWIDLGCGGGWQEPTGRFRP